jgi:hypothetical protein
MRHWSAETMTLAGGRTGHSSFTITAIDAGRRRVSECPVPLGKVVFEHTLELAGGGCVRVAKRAEVLGGAGPLLLMSAARMRRDTAQSLTALGRHGRHE